MDIPVEHTITIRADILTQIYYVSMVLYTMYRAASFTVKELRT
jgi:hypothetical protein